MPSKVQTYLAAAKPILGSLDGEGARIIRDSDGGLAVPTENSQRLYEAIEIFLQKTPEQLESMGKKSLEYYLQNFERIMILTKIENILKETLK